MVFALRARRYRPRGRRRYGPSTREVYAAIDLGTNNCRLLIARPAPDGFRVIDAFSRIVRLGEGLAASGFLSEQAMARTLEALRVCSSKLDRRAVTRVRAVATEACRRAGNCRAFLERVTRETGLELEIISHKEEAELAAQGCAPLLDPKQPYAIIFDIGGGSTEISLLEAEASEKAAGRSQPQMKGFLSLPYGVVTLAERHGGREVSRATYQAMVDEVLAVLMPFAVANDLGPAPQLQMLGTSGTVTTLAGIHLGLKRYDRGRVDGVELETQILRSVSERLLQQDFTRRAEEPCIGPERADLVLPGCAILEAILRAWPVDRLRIADRGLREGILFNLMRRAGEPGVAHLPLPRWGSQAA